MRERFVMKKTKSLDLGCGNTLRNPFGADLVFGIDLVGIETEMLKIVDLTIRPIPFQDATLDFVTAYDFLEHIPRLIYFHGKRIHPFIQLMNEIHRVLVPGGIFLACTPAFPRQEAFQDPTHVNFISENTVKYFAGEYVHTAADYGFHGEFELLRQEWASDYSYWLIWELAKK